MVLETFMITKGVCWFHFEKILLNEYEVQRSSNEANFLTDVLIVDLSKVKVII